MALVAVAIPIPPEKLAHWRRWTGELKAGRNREFVESRRKVSVRERTFYQETPMGSMVIVTLEGDHPLESYAQFGAQTDAFAKWFRDNVMAIHGVDLSKPLPGPAPELVVDSGAI